MKKNNKPVLNFSYNWNNKLQCKCYTSLRKSSRYKVGQEYRICLKDEYIHNARIIIKKKINVHELNDSISLIDTGYTFQETKKILERMYHGLFSIKNPEPYIYLYILRRT